MACLPRGARAPRREPEQREHKQHEAVTRRLNEDTLELGLGLGLRLGLGLGSRVGVGLAEAHAVYR